MRGRWRPLRRGRRLTIPRERPGRDRPSIHASYPTRERPGRDHEPRTPPAEHARAPACPRNIYGQAGSHGPSLSLACEISVETTFPLTFTPVHPTGPTTKTRWIPAPTSRRRASPSAPSSSTRTRRAPNGSRRMPAERRIARASTSTCGDASITAWRTSCSRIPSSSDMGSGGKA